MIIVNIRLAWSPYSNLLFYRRSAVITFKTKASAKKSFKRVLELLQANPLEEVLKGLLADDQS